jgi:DNA-binding response OmpR family regulator
VKQFLILLVDDEERILNFLKTKLKSLRYDVLVASNGIEALELIQAQAPDLIILDILMPKMDGFETLKRLRVFSSVPVIMLSARGDSVDRVKGLGLGADDYMIKPFNPDELVARIEAVRRRISNAAQRKNPDNLVMGRISIDFDKHIVLVEGQEVKLTRIEWLLLSELVKNSGSLIFYEELLTRVWGAEYRNDIQILRTWISRLRLKIEEDPKNPKIIKTASKTGYIFQLKPE